MLLPSKEWFSERNRLESYAFIFMFCFQQENILCTFPRFLILEKRLNSGGKVELAMFVQLLDPLPLPTPPSRSIIEMAGAFFLNHEDENIQ